KGPRGRGVKGKARDSEWLLFFASVTRRLSFPTWPLGPFPARHAGSEWIIAVGALLLVVLMLFILVLLNRTIRQLQQGANRLAQGELSHRVSVQGPLPLAMLAESLNRMAEQLQDRLGTIVEDLLSL